MIVEQQVIEMEYDVDMWNESRCNEYLNASESVDKDILESSLDIKRNFIKELEYNYIVNSI